MVMVVFDATEGPVPYSSQEPTTEPISRCVKSSGLLPSFTFLALSFSTFRSQRLCNSVMEWNRSTSAAVYGKLAK